MKRNLLYSTLCLSISLLLVSGCQKEINEDTPQITSEARAKLSGDELLKSVRQATSRFNSTAQAIKAGYVPDDHCVATPAGGMGYHWVNPSLIDNEFDPLQPEALLYANGPGGNLRLVALEYIVINTGQAMPMFGNQSFDVGGVPPLGSTPHWSLHVWLFENNPNGMFTPFNPSISCE